MTTDKPFAAIEQCIKNWENDIGLSILQSEDVKVRTVALHARADLENMRRLLEAASRAQRDHLRRRESIPPYLSDAIAACLGEK